MARPSTPEPIGRRRVLTTLAALGTTSVAAGTVSARGDPATSETAGTGLGVPLEPAGHLDFEGAAEAVVDDDGTTVYCSLVDGFGVLDVSDPAAPTVLYEERELEHEGEGPMESIMDVKVSGDRLLVSGPNGFGGTLSGFFLYDVSDPANPERVAFHETSFGPHNSFVDGDYVYLTGTGVRRSPVVIYDVADDDPEEVARWSASDVDDAWNGVSRNYQQPHDVYVQDGTLYVAYWDAGTWLVDVSDPENPSATAQLGSHDPAYLADLGQITPEFRELPGNSHYVQPNADGSVVFVGKEAWDDEDTDRDGGPGGIEIWDVSGSDPDLQTILAPPEPGPDEDEDAQWTSHNFGIDGDRLYTSWYGGGVRVYDVSDLAGPLLLGEWRDPETTAFWTAKPLESGFVATSYANPENTREEQREGEGARVYGFAEPDDADAEPAPTMARRDFPDPEDDPAGTTDSRTTDAGTTSERTTAAGTGEDGTTAEATATDGTTTQGLEDGTTEDGAGETTELQESGPTPGFGVLTALAGGGLGLWRLLARDDDET